MAANNPGREMQSDKPILLLTRPEADSLRFLEAMPDRVRAGCDVVVAPLFRIVSTGADVPEDGEIILSSTNGLPASKPRYGRVAWCVGENTALNAKSAGLDARLAGRNAAELVERLSDLSPRLLVHLRGQHSRGDIAGNLSKAGHDVREVITYVQAEEDWPPEIVQRLGHATCVVAPVFSPRSGRLLAERVPDFKVLHVVAMSNSVANDLNFVDSRHILVASEPDMDAMILSTSHMLDLVARVEGHGRAR